MADLLALAAELVAVPSVSLAEKDIADRVESALRSVGWLEVARVGDNVVARTQIGRPTRLLIAGHLDTVPPPEPSPVRPPERPADVPQGFPAGAAGAGNEAHQGGEVPPASFYNDGNTLWGLGAADMKGGIAVMLDLAASVPEPSVDVTYVFYVAEEIARAHSGLVALAAQRPDLVDGDVAIVCEPSGPTVQAGCQGVLKAEVVLRGVAAHVARPWMGRNALHRLGPLLSGIGSRPARNVQIDGCTYVESLQAVRAWGGGASNVLPASAGAALNYRFAPDLTVESAAAILREVVAQWLEEGDSFEVTDSAPAALPFLGHPLISRLVEISGRAPVAKLGWTDVAFFAERGVPAANFGPGDPELAHTAGEFVTRRELERAREVLGELLSH
ncbi:MAG TPA: succinyl-diaminopimelate desuccinylase [Acidimicrobiales bacterium]|nr:succinyl-diaminopimelate desuccinylase [Acidimicrobiales bacterium]